MPSASARAHHKATHDSALSPVRSGKGGLPQALRGGGAVNTGAGHVSRAKGDTWTGQGAGLMAQKGVRGWAAGGEHWRCSGAGGASAQLSAGSGRWLVEDWWACSGAPSSPSAAGVWSGCSLV